MNLVFLLEEASARDLLKSVVPRLVPAETNATYLVFEGKQDLERQVARKIRGWQMSDSAFVVLRDQDAADCRSVRQQLLDRVAGVGRSQILVRVACRQLESWIIGDWNAVSQAFGDPKLAAQGKKALYRQPDSISQPVDELRKFLPAYQKRDGARRVGPFLDPSRNNSQSFRAFCEGIKRLVDEARNPETR